MTAIDTAAPQRRLRQETSLARARTRAAVEGFTRATGITASGAILLALAGLAWVTGRVVAGRPLYLFAYGMFAVFGIAWLSARRQLALEGTRSDGRPRLREGEAVEMAVSLTAGRRLSGFVLEERVPESLGTPARVAVESVEVGESIGYTYKLTCRRRGVYQLGPLVAKWGDPFGLTQREKVLAEPFEMLVHPSVEMVQDRPLTRLFEDPPIRPPVSKPWPSGLEFYGMRKYEPGDDLRRIVWRAFARTGQLMVREAEQGITDKITILIDNNRRSHTRSEPSESFETACRVAASLGARHLREGYSVTLEFNDRRALPPLRGGNSQMRLLDALARAELIRQPVTDAIMRLVTDPHRDAHNVFVTPHLDAASAATLKLLVNRGASVLVVALMFREESGETLSTAASLGCQVVEVRPGVPLAQAFATEVGAGRR